MRDDDENRTRRGLESEDIVQRCSSTGKGSQGWCSEHGTSDSQGLTNKARRESRMLICHTQEIRTQRELTCETSGAMSQIMRPFDGLSDMQHAGTYCRVHRGTSAVPDSCIVTLVIRKHPNGCWTAASFLTCIEPPSMNVNGCDD